jgi:hypothetical protein
VKLDYRGVFLGAAEITLSYKVLWILSMILSALLFIYLVFEEFYLMGITKLTSTSNTNSFRSIFGNSSTVLWVILFIVAYVIICGVLGNINTIVCVLGAYRVDQGKKNQSLGQLIRDSLSYFWRLIGVQFVIGMFIGVALIPVICIFVLLITLTAGKGVTGTMSTVFYFVFFLLIEIVFMGFAQQTIAALIIENKSVSEAVRRGWEIFKTNLRRVLLLALPLSMIFVIGVGLILPIQSAVRHLLVEFSSSGNSFHTMSSPFNITIAIGYFLLYTIVAGILQVYFYSAWTSTFLRLTGISSKK